MGFEKGETVPYRSKISLQFIQSRICFFIRYTSRSIYVYVFHVFSSCVAYFSSCISSIIEVTKCVKGLLRLTFTMAYLNELHCVEVFKGSMMCTFLNYKIKLDIFGDIKLIRSAEGGIIHILVITSLILYQFL